MVQNSMEENKAAIDIIKSKPIIDISKYLTGTVKIKDIYGAFDFDATDEQVLAAIEELDE
jgi:hypothetical protein